MKQWESIPDRLSELRRILISCRHGEIFQIDESQASFQTAISYLAQLEDDIEKQLHSSNHMKAVELDVTREVREITNIGDSVLVLLLKAKNTIGQNND